MKQETVPVTISQRYARAYEQQYGTKELHPALLAYREIATGHPDTKEAVYSRTQIQNIVRAVVPDKILFESQLNLALNFSGSNDTPDERTVETIPTAPESVGG